MVLLGTLSDGEEPILHIVRGFLDSFLGFFFNGTLLSQESLRFLDGFYLEPFMMFSVFYF